MQLVFSNSSAYSTLLVDSLSPLLAYGKPGILVSCRLCTALLVVMCFFPLADPARQPMIFDGMWSVEGEGMGLGLVGPRVVRYPDQ